MPCLIEEYLCRLVAALPFECLQSRFMQLAFLAVIVCCPLAAAAGTLVVNFRMSFFSDAIGHSVFAGAAIGLLLGISPQLSLAATAVAIGFGILFLKRKSRLATDTVIGVLFSAVVAFGLSLAGSNPAMLRRTQEFMYGDILTVGWGDLRLLAAVTVAFFAFECAAYNRLIAIGLNEQLAKIHRVRVQFYQYAHIALLSLVVVLCVKTVGVLLVTALLIVPAAAARNLATGAGKMFWYAIAIGMFSGVSGLLLSAQVWTTAPTGAVIVLTSCAVFVISLIVKRLR